MTEGESPTNHAALADNERLTGKNVMPYLRGILEGEFGIWGVITQWRRGLSRCR